MSELFFLPAQYGDAFFLHCQKGHEEGWMVVDGGPVKLRPKSVFLQEVEKLPRIDLMVLTHHDDDHIEGIRAYVNQHKADNPFPVKTMWVNCARHIDIAQGGSLTAKHASSLADTLVEIQKNQEIEWKEYVTDNMDTSEITFADIDVLSPSKEILERYIIEYEKKAGVLQPKALPLTAKQEEDDLSVSLKDLALRPKIKLSENNYQVLANMASIAFILRCDDMSVLMLGDSFPQQIEGSLAARVYSKENKLKVDFVKVSHHGSRHNISNELLDMIDCQNYLISTDGGKGETYHPTREALANIICHPSRDYGKTVHLHFNYTLKSIAHKNGFALFNQGEKEEYNFEVHEPTEQTEGSHYWATRYE